MSWSCGAGMNAGPTFWEAVSCYWVDCLNETGKSVVAAVALISDDGEAPRGSSRTSYSSGWYMNNFGYRVVGHSRETNADLDVQER